MGWFDQLGYNLAPLFGPIGKGLADASQDSRVANVNNQFITAPDSQSLAAVPLPDNIYSPSHIAELQNLREKRLGFLQQVEAAPVSKMLNQFRADGNDADPNFSGAEWLKGMATTYPVNGQTMSPEGYDAAMSGAVPAAKTGQLPISALAANPVTAKLLQDAATAAQDKGTMGRVFADGYNAKPMDLASIAMNKEQSVGFKDTGQALEQLAKRADKGAEDNADNTLNATVAAYPLNRGPLDGPGGWNGLADALRKIPNIKPATVDATLKELAAKNTNAPAGIPMHLHSQSRDATTDGNVQTNMFGAPISETKTTTTNHPPAVRDPAILSNADFQKTYAKLLSKQAQEASIQKGGDGFGGMLPQANIDAALATNRAAQAQLKAYIVGTHPDQAAIAGITLEPAKPAAPAAPATPVKTGADSPYWKVKPK